MGGGFTFINTAMRIAFKATEIADQATKSEEILWIFNKIHHQGRMPRLRLDQPMLTSCLRLLWRLSFRPCSRL